MIKRSRDEALDALVSRNSADDIDVADQVAALENLTDERLEILKKRLDVVDAYKSLPKPTAADAKQAAARLGMVERSFYRFLRNIELHGPVRGLAPYQPRNGKRRLTKDGLGSAGEAALRHQMEKRPAAALGEAVREVLEAIRLAGDPLPSPSTVQLRLNALQGRPRPRHLLAGRELSIVTVPVKLVMTRRGRRIPMLATFLLDHDTHLICGADHDVTAARSIDDCLDDAQRTRIGQLVRSGVPFASTTEVLRWQVPEDLNVDQSGWLDGARTSMPQTEIILASANQDLIKEVVGDAFSEILAPEKPPLGDQSSLQWPVVVRGRTPLSEMVNAWNEKVLASAKPRARRDVDDGQRLKQDLNTLFRPLIARCIEAEHAQLTRQR